jgi:hypothetical protein
MYVSYCGQEASWEATEGEKNHPVLTYHRTPGSLYICQDE